MKSHSGRCARETIVIVSFATGVTPVLYLLLSLFKMAALVQWNDVGNTTRIWHLFIFSLLDDVLFFPWPSFWLWAAIGIICGLVWLSGGFWCGKLGKWRYGDRGFYDRPENIVRRCRLLGAICGIPCFLAVCAYYALLIYQPNVPAGAVFIWVVGSTLVRPPHGAGPEAELLNSLPRLAAFYVIKGAATLGFIAIPCAGSAAIGAACGWFYGRFARPVVRRCWPSLPPAA